MKILNLGLNCHIKSKFDIENQKLEIEKLYSTIKNLHDKEEIEIESVERLKCELKRYGINEAKDFNKCLLSKEDRNVINELRNDDSISIRKADKSNAFVIMNRTDYETKINNILNDETKFSKVTEPVDKVINNSIKKLNDIIQVINEKANRKIFNKVTGHKSPGYIYGTCKIHKNVSDPPLRPVISTIPTPAYEVSKILNKIITKYMPREYTCKSTNEFISLIKSQKPDNVMASLDVEGLFTNVPVHETIEIILQHVYDNEDPSLTPPDIPKNYLKCLLEICTTDSTFFSPNGTLFRQIDGVSMGCILGPTVANYYVGHLERKVFRTNPEIKPKTYVRYVDDTFGSFKSNEHVLQLKDIFEVNSCLKFTFEIEKEARISFLDVNVLRKDSSYETSVYVKTTNNGDCLNFESLCPMRYKEGVIKTFLHRAYNVCSTWNTFHSEVRRIKQLLINNNFPI